MRAKCKVRGEIVEESFIFFDSPRQEKAKPEDQIYFMIFARQIRKDQYWLTLKSLKYVFFIWQTFHYSMQIAPMENLKCTTSLLS